MNNYKTIYGHSTDREQGNLLRHLIQNLEGDLNIMELGSFYGRLAVLWTDILKERRVSYQYTTCDNFTMNGVAMVKDELLANLERFKTGAKFVQSDDIKLAEEYKDGTFDIVYIDTDHSAKHVEAAIKAWLPKVKIGGYICGDDFHTDFPGVETAVKSVFSDFNKLQDRQWYVKVSRDHSVQKPSGALKKADTKANNGLDKAEA